MEEYTRNLSEIDNEDTSWVEWSSSAKDQHIGQSANGDGFSRSGDGKQEEPEDQKKKNRKSQSHLMVHYITIGQTPHNALSLKMCRPHKVYGND